MFVCRLVDSLKARGAVSACVGVYARRLTVSSFTNRRRYVCRFTRSASGERTCARIGGRRHRGSVATRGATPRTCRSVLTCRTPRTSPRKIFLSTRFGDEAGLQQRRRSGISLAEPRVLARVDVSVQSVLPSSEKSRAEGGYNVERGVHVYRRGGLSEMDWKLVLISVRLCLW